MPKIIHFISQLDLSDATQEIKEENVSYKLINKNIVIECEDRDAVTSRPLKN